MIYAIYAYLCNVDHVNVLLGTECPRGARRNQAQSLSFCISQCLCCFNSLETKQNLRHQWPSPPFLAKLATFSSSFFTFCSLGIEGVSPFDDQTLEISLKYHKISHLGVPRKTEQSSDSQGPQEICFLNPASSCRLNKLRLFCFDLVTSSIASSSYRL